MSVALFDWDNTLHQGWTLEGWMRFLVERGVLDAAGAPAWEALKDRYLAGEMSHSRLAVEANVAYAAAIAGHDVAALRRLARDFVAETDHATVYPWTAPLLRWLARRGVRPVIVTGAPELVMEEHMKTLYLTEHVQVYGLALRTSRPGRPDGDTAGETPGDPPGDTAGDPPGDTAADPAGDPARRRRAPIPALDPELGAYDGRIARNPGPAPAKRRLAARVTSGGEATLAAGDSPSDLALLRAARAQLVVGRHGQPLARRFGPTAVWLEDPQSATPRQVTRLVSTVIES